MDARKGVGDFANVSKLLLNVPHSVTAVGTATTMIAARIIKFYINLFLCQLFAKIWRLTDISFWMAAILDFNLNLASMLLYMYFIN